MIGDEGIKVSTCGSRSVLGQQEGPHQRLFIIGYRRTGHYLDILNLLELSFHAGQLGMGVLLGRLGDLCGDRADPSGRGGPGGSGFDHDFARTLHRPGRVRHPRWIPGFCACRRVLESLPCGLILIGVTAHFALATARAQFPCLTGGHVFAFGRERIILLIGSVPEFLGSGLSRSIRRGGGMIGLLGRVQPRRK